MLRKLAIVLVTLVASTSAFAQTLYSATGGNTNSNLYTLNPATGAVLSTIGPIGFAVTGMAVHPTTGVLYAVTTAQSPSNPGSLVTINKVTGAGTLVGALGLTPVADITFTPNGTLFGWSEAGDDLVTINTSTGAATAVGNSGLSTFGSGLASNAAGILFFAGDGATNELRTVSTSTGLPTTIVANMTGSPQGDAVPALAFHPNTGVLFGLDGLDGNPVVFLITINTTTGVITSIGQTLNNTDAIAFDSSAVATAVTAVPTLSETGLLLLALAMATMGAVAYSRRKGI